MRKNTKHFILNKKEDFAEGCGAVYADGRMKIIQSYLSGVFDSGEKNTGWYRISGRFDLPENSNLAISIYCTDNYEIFYNNKIWTLDELIASDMKIEERIRALEPLKKKQVKFSSDILITELTGRYLIFAIESTMTGKQPPALYEMSIYFRPNMWLDDLPEVFRGEKNGFLERYLAIFQTMHEEMGEEIDGNLENYVASTADFDFLKWLCSWYCMMDVNLWTEGQLRYLLKNSYRIYQELGTRKVMEEVCTLYLGEKPEIIEYSQKYASDFKDVNHLGEKNIFIHPNVFTVVVETSLTKLQQDAFGKIVDGCKPAHMEANIIFLQKTKGDAGIVLV
jgi:phage tail-like protein